MKSWKTVAEALAEELRSVRPDWSADLPDVSHKKEEPYDPAPLRKLYAAVAKLQGEKIGPSTLAALCLSGGGIRSATFNLGVLQALARLGLLPLFDYLSTVSGGGYVGSWLQAWIHERRRGRTYEAALADVVGELAASDGAATRDPLAPEAKPIDRLREYSNYLTPRKGLLSGDTWAVVAIVARNLLLNWLVIVPLLAAVVVVPQLAVLVAHEPRLAVPSSVSATALAEVALGLALASSFVTHWVRAHRRGPKASSDEKARRWQGRMRSVVTMGTLGLFLVAAVLFLVFALVAPDDPLRHVPILPVRSSPAGPGERFLAAAVWTIGVPVVGAVAGWCAWLVREGLRAAEEPAATDAREAPASLWQVVRDVLPARVGDLVALAVSGAAAAGALAWLTDGPWSTLRHHPRLVALLGVPALVAIYALARVLFIAVASAFESRDAGDDADREWWARITGRALAVAAAWPAAGGLVLLGQSLLHGGLSDLLHHWGITGTVALGAVSSSVVALLGRGEGTSSGRGSRASASPLNELLLRAAAPLAVASIFVLLAAGTATVGEWMARGDASDGARLAALVWLGLYSLLVSFVAGIFVDVNRFSLHGMYRNRLVRAYLGASSADRRPNLVSGFDPEDGELRLASLLAKSRATRLFPVVNVTLNLIRGEKLAWQERQAESFTMTPLHCGNFYEGYRDTAEYGAHRGGITLGTAMAISGAAASPNMGYVSTPALTFLLGLFNARLGVWLANPNENGKVVVSSPGPWHATVHLLRELLGSTNRYSPFVNLSDGGHFENLGLYEAVLRRCRLVVVCDAGCDPGSGFGDLGNAIRKIRIDFGIPITFAKGIEILPRTKEGAPPDRPGLYCAIGTIHYDAVDPAGAPDGKIIYLKPTLARSGDAAAPYDVLAYALGNATFPHETTADQWFSEAQFEAYRALGAHLVSALVPGALPAQPTLGDLYAAAERHVAKGAQAPAAETVPQPPPAGAHGDGVQGGGAARRAGTAV